MSLDISCLKVGKAINVDEVDAFFQALYNHLPDVPGRGALSPIDGSVLSEARTSAMRVAGLDGNFYERLSGNLEPLRGEGSSRNAWDLELGRWCSVRGLNEDLRAFTGLALEDAFPVAAVLTDEITLPDWRVASRKFGQMRDKLVNFDSRQVAGDDRRSSMISGFADLLRQSGYNLPEGAVTNAKALAGAASANEGSAELVAAVDAMAETVECVLRDTDSRYLILWSN